jgi:hypothetical protein
MKQLLLARACDEEFDSPNRSLHLSIMVEAKCERCMRREVCSLRPLPQLTLPWVVEAHKSPGSEWDRTQRIGRALRGCGSSPGYVEDWRIAGALSHEDVTELLRTILRNRDVNLAHLCAFCRQYQGPDLAESRWRERAA